MWELLIAAINKPVSLVKTVRKDLAAAQNQLEQLKLSLGPGEHPAIDEKVERISRIKAVLRSSLRDQDDMIVSSIRYLILLGNQCYQRLGGVGLKRSSSDSDDAGDDSDFFKSPLYSVVTLI